VAMAFSFLPLLEYGRGVLRLRDAPSIMLAAIGLILAVFPPGEVFALRAALVVVILVVLGFAVVRSRQTELTESQDKADIHSRFDERAANEALLQAKLDDLQEKALSKVPMPLGNLIVAFYDLSREVRDFLSFQEVRRLAIVWRGFETTTFDQLSESEKAELVERLTRENNNLTCTFNSDLRPKIIKLLDSARDAGHPVTLYEQVLTNPVSEPVDIAAIQLLLRRSAETMRR